MNKPYYMKKKILTRAGHPGPFKPVFGKRSEIFGVLRCNIQPYNTRILSYIYIYIYQIPDSRLIAVVEFQLRIFIVKFTKYTLYCFVKGSIWIYLEQIKVGPNVF